MSDMYLQAVADKKNEIQFYLHGGLMPESFRRPDIDTALELLREDMKLSPFYPVIRRWSPALTQDLGEQLTPGSLRFWKLYAPQQL